MNISIRNLLLTCGAIVLVCLIHTTVLAQSVSNPKAAARQAKLAEIERLEETVKFLESSVQHKQNQIHEYEDEIGKLERMQSEKIAKQDSLGVSSESFPEIIRSLQLQRVELMIDLAGLKAREEAMILLREQENSNTNRDAIKSMSQILELQREQLDQVEKLHKAQSVPASQVRNSKIQVLNSELKLAQLMKPESNSETTTAFLDVSLDVAEKQARLDKTESLLNSITESRKSIQLSDSLGHQILERRKLVSDLANEVSKMAKDSVHMMSTVEKLKSELNDD